MAAYRIILADDHFSLRAGLLGLLETIRGDNAVAEAHDELELSALISKLRPQMLLMGFAAQDPCGGGAGDQREELPPRWSRYSCFA